MSEITFWHDFFAGWLSGIAGTAVGHPLDTVKVRQQVMNTKIIYAVKATYKTEGIRGYYRGMLFPLLTMGPSNSIFFGIYGNCMKYLQENPTKERMDHMQPHFYTNVFLAGCVGGFFQILFTCPVEVVKTVLQVDVRGKAWKKHFAPGYSGMTSAIIGIVKTRGLAGLYTGLTPFAVRDVPSSGVYMLVYEHLYYSTLRNRSESFKSIVAGGIAGVISWIIVIPFDVVKNRIQTDDPNNRQYKGMIDCIVKSYRGEGMKVFFVGSTAICMRALVVNCVGFYIYEKVLGQFRT